MADQHHITLKHRSGIPHGIPWQEWTGRPDKAGIARAFDALASTYDGMYSDRRSLAEDDITGRLVRNFLGTCPFPGYVLDVGSGTGYLPRLLGPALPPALYVGVDPSEAMVEQAQRNAPGYQFIHGTAKDAPEFPAHRFNAVLALNGTLGHDPCLGCTLGWLRRLTGKGAGFLGMFYGLASLDRSPMDEHGIPRWILRRVEPMKRVFSTYGWEVTAVTGFGGWMRDRAPITMPRWAWRSLMRMEMRMIQPEQGYHVVVTARRMP